MKPEEIKKAVQSSYSKIALQNLSCCRGSSCRGNSLDSEKAGLLIGYKDDDLTSVPEGANLGLGCGNPVALASLREGEIVMDLGSGAGFDAFLAANKVGEAGKVIGVDMTPEMIEKAKANAAKGDFRNVEFRLGEIESLPASDNEVDAVISNCVINLSPDKKQVFREAFRVLKPGGRLMISDIVLLKNLPEQVRQSIEAYVGCIAGAVLKHDYMATISEAGFEGIKVMGEDLYSLEGIIVDPIAQAIMGHLNLSAEEAKELSSSVASIKVSAVKPN